MTNPLIEEWHLPSHRRHSLERPNREEDQLMAAPPPRVSRVARLMALALRFERLVLSGQAANYADLARLGKVTRARMSQILNLLQLAPDLQERVLFLTRPERGRDPMRLARLQPIAQALNWRKQRQLWRERIGVKIS